MDGVEPLLRLIVRTLSLTHTHTEIDENLHNEPRQAYKLISRSNEEVRLGEAQLFTVHFCAILDRGAKLVSQQFVLLRVFLSRSAFPPVFPIS